MLGEGIATSYRVAKALGKAAASIYQTLDSLEQKGVVIVDDGEKRLCRAVPAGEMLSGSVLASAEALPSARLPMLRSFTR